MHFKSTLLITLSVFVATGTFILASEAVLFGTWKLTGSTKLDTLYGNSIYWERWHARNTKYPDEPDKLLKIAIYGGSSAEGASAERNLADVIKRNLEKSFGKMIYVRNYAASGNSFHREQAEILKALLPFYDVSIKYAGNNEWGPPFDDADRTPIFNIEVKEKKSRGANSGTHTKLSERSAWPDNAVRLSTPEQPPIRVSLEDRRMVQKTHIQRLREIPRWRESGRRSI